MSSQKDTGVVTFTAGEALEPWRRVRLSAATEKTVVYADAGEGADGITQMRAADTARVPVKLLKGGAGTYKVEAAGGISINAKVYGAAAGKVSETVSGEAVFKALEAASGSGSIIEAIEVAESGIGGGGAVGVDWQESVLDRLTTPGGSEVAGNRILVITAASGVFAGQEDSIAILEQDASWTFIAPTEGMATRVEAEDVLYFYDGSAWVGNAHIADPAACAGQTAVDPIADAAGITAGNPGACAGQTGVDPIADAAGITAGTPGAMAGITFTHSWNDSTDPSAAEGAAIIADLDAAKTAVDANKAEVDKLVTDITSAQAAIAANNTTIEATVDDAAALKTAVDANKAEIDKSVTDLTSAQAAIVANNTTIEATVDDVVALKTAIDANNAAIDSLLAQLAAVGFHAAS